MRNEKLITWQFQVPLTLLPSLSAEELCSNRRDQFCGGQTRRYQAKLACAKNEIGIHAAGNAYFPADDADDLHLWAGYHDLGALLNGELIHCEQFVIHESPD